jgi:hypothetical protein
MDERDYYQIFQDLGFEVNPLPEYYDPDSYGRKLMEESNITIEVSYSSSTDYVYAN